MLGKFIAVKVFRVESVDLVDSLIERDAVSVSCDDIGDSLLIDFRSPVVIEGEGRVIIEE